VTAVQFCEVLLRDGIQSWPRFIPTAEKIRLLDAITAAGVQEVDAASFVSEKLVPQFSDRLDVLAAIDHKVRVRVLTVNAQGAQGVIEAHKNVRRIDLCGIPFSVSEPHNLANLRRSHAEHREAVTRMVENLLAAGIRPLIGVVTAFGCPIRGRIDPQESLQLAHWAYDLGVRDIMFGDTTGLADPVTVARLFSAASVMDGVNLIAHFHDNRGAGIANTLAAIGAGATTVDACLGGIGGEPKAIELGLVGDQGNVTSEDLVAVLAAMGVETGIDPDALLRAGAIAEEIIGQPLFSKVQRAGLMKLD
jgi:hydroxymethylglutaryl-CoA lyase